MFQMSRKRMRAAAVCLALTMCPFMPGYAQTVTVVVQEGDAAPDGNGTFSSFNNPALNDVGQAAFRGFLTGTNGGPGDNTGIFRGDGMSGGGPTQIVRAGQASPDGNSTFSSFKDPAINNAGQAAFDATLTSTSGGSVSGIFRGDGTSGGSPTRIVSAGQAAPDGNGTFSTFLNFPPLNGAGQVVFRAYLSGTSDAGSGIFRGDGASGGGLTQIAREGQAAPDGNGTFSDFFPPALNDAGQAAFVVALSGASGGTSNDRGLYRGDGVTGLVRIAREGDAAPGGNGTFSGFGSPSLNDAGQAAFTGFLNGTNGAAGDDSGIFRGDGTLGPTQIAREGQAAPDGNGTFSSFESLAINNAGQITFFASLAGTSGVSGDNSGIFRGDGTTGPTQIAREGDAAPGGNGTFSTFDSLAINDAGQAAFLASLTTDGGADGRGLFFHDDALGLLAVAREGEAFLGSTITNLGFTGSAGNLSDERSGLNELGQIAYYFELADGNSGIAILTVPEPGAAALLVLGGLTLINSRWRRRPAL